MKQRSLLIEGGLLLTIVGIGVVLVWANFPGRSVEPDTSSKKLSVVTTLFPLYDFARSIGGEYAEVSLLLPPGVESHSFEPKPSDMIRIDQSDIFVYTGKAMEPWAEDVRKGIRPSVIVVDSSRGIEPLGEAGDADVEQGHTEGVDPHIWLDFDNAARMVSMIAEAMIAKDPENTETYRRNAEAYRIALSALDESYRSGLADCETREVVYGGHAAFGYLARRYDLHFSSAQGFSPDSEPTAKDLIALTEQVQTNRIGAIFYEELGSPKIAETIARETDARLLLLNAAHNITRDDVEKGITYLDIMEENLENLKAGLACR